MEFRKFLLGLTVLGCLFVSSSVFAAQWGDFYYMVSGSRRQPLPELRKNLAGVLLEEYGLTLAGAARHLGVSTSAVALMLKRAQ